MSEPVTVTIVPPPAPPRLTLEALRVLARMLAEPDRAWYGYALVRETGLPQGTVYPMLDRLVAEGLLSVRPVVASGRRPTRYVDLTGWGEAVAKAALDSLLVQPTGAEAAS
ncbi:PadR family transcriptional regulator [Spirillospora sp. CA-253888]